MEMQIWPDKILITAHICHLFFIHTPTGRMSCFQTFPICAVVKMSEQNENQQLSLVCPVLPKIEDTTPNLKMTQIFFIWHPHACLPHTITSDIDKRFHSQSKKCFLFTQLKKKSQKIGTWFSGSDSRFASGWGFLRKTRHRCQKENIDSWQPLDYHCEDVQWHFLSSKTLPWMQGTGKMSLYQRNATQKQSLQYFEVRQMCQFLFCLLSPLLTYISAIVFPWHHVPINSKRSKNLRPMLWTPCFHFTLACRKESLEETELHESPEQSSISRGRAGRSLFLTCWGWLSNLPTFYSHRCWQEDKWKNKMWQLVTTGTEVISWFQHEEMHRWRQLNTKHEWRRS